MISRSALSAYQNHESDRIELFYYTPQDKKAQELWQPKNNASDDVQSISAGREGMAQAAGIQRDSIGSGRESVSQRFNNGEYLRLTD